MSFKNNPAISPLLRMTLIPVVLGLFAGATGAMFAESYLAATSSPAQESALIQIGRPSPSAPSAPVEGDLADRLDRVDIALYPRKVVAGTDLADRARAPYEAVGYATVITSDGWLATHQSVLSAGPVSADVGGRLLDPTSQIVDPRTGIVFLKIEASALAVAGFEDTASMRAGTQLYAQGQEGLFIPARFGGAILPDRKIQAGVLHDTDKFTLSYRLDRAMDSRSVGGAVMTSSGNLAGIVAPDPGGIDAFVPIHLLQPILAEVFRGEAPARASLGARYLVSSETAFAEPQPSGFSGVVLSGSRATGSAAVKLGSAAARAGLMAGDSIISIDGVDLSSGHDLAELIADYASGSKARFDISRKGERMSLEVTFD